MSEGLEIFGKKYVKEGNEWYEKTTVGPKGLSQAYWMELDRVYGICKLNGGSAEISSDRLAGEGPVVASIFECVEAVPDRSQSLIVSPPQPHIIPETSQGEEGGQKAAQIDRPEACRMDFRGETLDASALNGIKGYRFHRCTLEGDGLEKAEYVTATDCLFGGKVFEGAKNCFVYSDYIWELGRTKGCVIAVNIFGDKFPDFLPDGSSSLVVVFGGKRDKPEREGNLVFVPYETMALRKVNGDRVARRLLDIGLLEESDFPEWFLDIYGTKNHGKGDSCHFRWSSPEELEESTSIRLEFFGKYGRWPGDREPALLYRMKEGVWPENGNGKRIKRSPSPHPTRVPVPPELRNLKA